MLLVTLWNHKVIVIKHCFSKAIIGFCIFHFNFTAVSLQWNSLPMTNPNERITYFTIFIFMFVKYKKYIFLSISTTYNTTNTEYLTIIYVLNFILYFPIWQIAPMYVIYYSFHLPQIFWVFFIHLSFWKTAAHYVKWSMKDHSGFYIYSEFSLSEIHTAAHSSLLFFSSEDFS